MQSYNLKLFYNETTGLIDIIGSKMNFKRLNSIQAQTVLLKLNCEPDALFEALWAFEENGWNETDLGLTGSFMYGNFKGVLQ